MNPPNFSKFGYDRLLRGVLFSTHDIVELENWIIKELRIPHDKRISAQYETPKQNMVI